MTDGSGCIASTPHDMGLYTIGDRISKLYSVLPKAVRA